MAGRGYGRTFADLKIREVESFRKHLNQYDVIRINMQEFLSITHDMDEMLSMLQKRLLRELKKQYPEYIDGDYLIFAMKDVFSSTKHPFVILIDEWDCVFRNLNKTRMHRRNIWIFTGMAERSGICCIGIHDRYSSGEEIWFSFCIEYVYRIFNVKSQEMAEFLALQKMR